MDKSAFFLLAVLIIILFILPELFPNSIILFLVMTVIVVLIWTDLIYEYVKRRRKKQ